MSNPVTRRINKELKKLGREEQLVRCPAGYYYYFGGEYGWKMESLYMYRLDPEDFEMAAAHTEFAFRQVGVTLHIPR